MVHLCVAVDIALVAAAAVAVAFVAAVAVAGVAAVFFTDRLCFQSKQVMICVLVD